MIQIRMANEGALWFSQHLLKQKTDYGNWDGKEE